MTLEEIRTFLKEINFSNPGSLTYNVAIVVMTILTSDNYTEKGLVDKTRLEPWELRRILKGLKEHHYLIDGKIIFESHTNDYEFIVELALMGLVIQGSVIKQRVKI